MKVRWAKNAAYECDEPFTGNDGKSDHRCIKDQGHTTDPTNDDHQCCCGVCEQQ